MEYSKSFFGKTTIDSSDLKQANEIMRQIEELRKKEGLKAVIYDVYKIRESLEKNKQDIIEEH